MAIKTMYVHVAVVTVLTGHKLGWSKSWQTLGLLHIHQVNVWLLLCFCVCVCVLCLCLI